MTAPRPAFFRVSLAALLLFMSLTAAFTPTLALFARDLGASVSGVGAIVAVGSLLGSVVRVPAGALSTLIGRRRLLLGGAAVCGLAPLLPVLLPPVLPVLWLLSAVYALASAFMPAALAYVHDLFPESDRGTHVGYYTTFAGIGAALGPLASGGLLGHLGPLPDLAQYRYIYAFCAAAGGLSFALLLRLPATRRLPPTAERLAALVLRDLKAATAQRQLFLAYAARLVQALAMGTVSAFFPVYGREVAGLSEGQIGLLLGTNRGMAVLTRPLTTHLSRWGGRVPFVVAGMTIVSAALVLIAGSTRFAWLWLLFAALGIGEAAGQIATITFLTDVAGKRLFGAAAGLVGTFFEIGLALGQVIPGVLIPLFGSPPLYASGYLPAFGVVSGTILSFAVVAARRLREPSGIAQPVGDRGWGMG